MITISLRMIGVVKTTQTLISLAPKEMGTHSVEWCPAQLRSRGIEFTSSLDFFEASSHLLDFSYISFVEMYHMFYSRFSHDVTAAMLVYRTIAKKVFWEFAFIIM